MNNKIIIACGVVLLLGGGLLYAGSRGNKNNYQAAPSPAVPSTANVVESSGTPSADTPPPPAKTYTMSDVAGHATQASCWTTIRGSVYNLTEWIAKHPGGEQAILGICGNDGTDKFVGKHGGNAKQEALLASFVIGKLAP